MGALSILPNFEDVRRARTRIAGVAHSTPVLTSREANRRTGSTVFFKAENFQRTGSFKFRGAANAIAGLSPEMRKRGVLAFSSGNHAQAVACAAQIAGIAACIVMPTDAPSAKLDATRAYGADIVLYDRRAEDREAIARQIASDRGMVLIPPFDHADVIAGQGTCAAELFESVGPLDMLVACVGGGGLLAGSIIAARSMSADCRVIGVEPEAGNDVQRSLQEGRRVRIGVPASIADGALTQQVGEIPFAILRDSAATIVTVPDAALRSAMHFFAERMKIVVEPTGCLGAAALLSGAIHAEGLRVGVIISGGNVSLPNEFFPSLA